MFGGIVRALGSGSGTTQQLLADAAGISTVYVSALESERKPAPPHTVVIALSSALTVDEMELWATARYERERRVARTDGRPRSLRSGAGEGSGRDKASANDTLSFALQLEPLPENLSSAIRSAAIRIERPIHLIDSLQLSVEQIELSQREIDG
ncbi:helix-turn-helix domain-containing protein [Candidatus Bipolaricaulota bacterium]|nr:helix-turn-helix domain-containing protein [Candidatus Bipolaricaulota bacterium]